ncbi:MAG: hypothetical protein HWQ35_17860 [Nostoc sp. NMS1]|uniref:hypothetical protein n=1 Tax=Nostoc sp. NMS1 TaxID=2815388 RepID=UPI0025DB530B|nr:hypothetical protein [Nostoc sp. NMS1]MBN3907107.1 hypothetical protein [Nostoc sp. NMS1]MBN3908332.1 hypothetical protein [Nostoc sp. NMS1]
MAYTTETTPSLQVAELDDSPEKIFLPPTDPNAEIIEIPGYRLVYVNGACPKNYRVYKAHSMIGVIFQHITHWSNAMDQIRYAQAAEAAVGLDDFMKVAKKSRVTDKAIAA